MAASVVAYDFTTWMKYALGVCGAEPFAQLGVLRYREREHHRQCSSKLTTFDRTLVVKLKLAAFCYYKAQVVPFVN
jgi:hypothetical protein